MGLAGRGRGNGVDKGMSGLILGKQEVNIVMVKQNHPSAETLSVDQKIIPNQRILDSNSKISLLYSSHFSKFLTLNI